MRNNEKQQRQSQRSDGGRSRYRVRKMQLSTYIRRFAERLLVAPAVPARWI